MLGQKTTCIFLLLVVEISIGCFLNSCPYRRLGRSSGCGQCGEQSDGLCVNPGVCCLPKICVETDECPRDGTRCQIPACMLEGMNGICISQTTCCVGKICGENLQCMTGINRQKGLP